jgi:ADP-heptose:LPS heptosyltransferase
VAHFAKSLERRVRRGFIRSLQWFPRRGSTDQITPGESPSILLIRHDRIGDAIISTPIFALLRKRFPAARIDLLLGRRNAAVASLLPFVDNCIVLPGSFSSALNIIARIRRTRYDVAINLLAKDSASGSLLSLFSGAATRIGFQGETASAYDILIPHPEQPVHIVSETSLLLAPLGIPPIGEEPQRTEDYLTLTLTDDLIESARQMVATAFSSDNPVVVVNISGSGPEKFWGADNYVRLAAAIRRIGLRAIFAGSPADREMVSQIARESNVQSLPPTDSYAEFAAMLSLADMIVTPDTSVVHLAAALHKPTVMLIASPSDFIPWRPWGTPHIVVRHNSSIASIAVEDVGTALFQLASETIGPAHSSPRP